MDIHENNKVDIRLDQLKVTRASIIPFQEHPGMERTGYSTVTDNKINAAALFSYFTANIIREEVLFTR